MALKQQYPADFEQVWQAYPSWPKGRSVKQAAFKKFRTLKKELGWGEEEIDELVAEIEEQKRHRKSWQKGDTYGPQGLQVWLNQHGWEHDYPRAKKGSFVSGIGSIPDVPASRPQVLDAEQQAAGEAAVNKLREMGVLRRVK